MSDQSYEIIVADKAGYFHKPVKMWTRGVQVEQKALDQAINVAKLPFIHKHVAIMPDVHWGMGATIGSVIPTYKAIIPAAVGVDIGCGMMAVRTNHTSHDLPDNLSGLRSLIEAAVPHGRTDNGGKNDRGAWGEVPDEIGQSWDRFVHQYEDMCDKHPRARARNTARQLGTLGTGNHFIEICLDETDRVWAMLHSGSRGPGNKIGMYFIQKAKRDMERWFINLPDADLAYIPEGSPLFKDYMDAVHWAQDFALINRKIMMKKVIRAIGSVTNGDTLYHPIDDVAINCHHNYVAKENHHGKNVWITRKGAVRARKDDLGIIPGSMGAKSFIVRGKGNVDSFQSCSHGAGRAMSRTQARIKYTLDDHIAATEGVECRKDADVIDETPGAYKDIDAVMAAQSDLVDIVHTLKQIVCVKG